jgi:hypothetical protein
MWASWSLMNTRDSPQTPCPEPSMCTFSSCFLTKDLIIHNFCFTPFFTYPTLSIYLTLLPIRTFLSLIRSINPLHLCASLMLGNKLITTLPSNTDSCNNNIVRLWNIFLSSILKKQALVPSFISHTKKKKRSFNTL